MLGGPEGPITTGWSIGPDHHDWPSQAPARLGYPGGRFCWGDPRLDFRAQGGLFGNGLPSWTGWILCGLLRYIHLCIYTVMEAMIQALSDPRRRTIVEVLAQGEQPVGALVDRLPIAQSGVSRHLRILREAGVVQVRAQGQQRLYALRPESLDVLSDWLQEVRRTWAYRLDRFEAELMKETDR